MSGQHRGSDQPQSQGKMSLLTLPLEMFERFAELCDPSDLLALRLVSRDAAKKVKRTFIGAHFVERSVLATRRRLSRATWIAKHPDFGPALQTLLIRLDDIHEQDEAYERRRLRSKKYQAFAASNNILPIETLSLGGKRVSKYDSKRELLVEYFSVLGKNSQLKALSLWEADGHHYDTEGARDAPEKVFSTKDAKLVFDALSESNLCITGLGIGFDGFGRPAKLKEFLKPWPVTLANLQTLRLNAYSLNALAKKSLAVIETIAELPLLRELELIQDADPQIPFSPQGDFMSRFFTGRFPSLEKLCLCHLAVSVHELLKFLQRKSANTPLRVLTGHFLYIEGLPDYLRGSNDQLKEELIKELGKNGDLYVVLEGHTVFERELLISNDEE